MSKKILAVTLFPVQKVLSLVIKLYALWMLLEKVIFSAMFLRH